MANNNGWLSAKSALARNLVCTHKFILTLEESICTCAEQTSLASIRKVAKYNNKAVMDNINTTLQYYIEKPPITKPALVS